MWYSIGFPFLDLQKSELRVRILSVRATSSRQADVNRLAAVTVACPVGHPVYFVLIH
jgi:hypothetical protein